MKLRILLLNLVISQCIFAQYKFGETPKFDINDLKREKPELEADAPAEVIYRAYRARIDTDGHMYTEVISRVKIYKKDKAEDKLSHEISLYDKSRSRENLDNLKAFTYNLVNGEVQATKVEKDSRFKSKEMKYNFVTKFTFPNVKDGSIVEYQYKIDTPFLMSLPAYRIEDTIPIKYIEYMFEYPSVLGYNISYKGELIPKFREVEKNTNYSINRFGYLNVPAHKDESFVRNNDNYRTTIKAELNSTSFEGDFFKSYGLTWKDIGKRLYENEGFGKQLNKDNLVKNLLPENILAISKPDEKMTAILQFVQNNYKWNDTNDVVASEDGIKGLLNSKTGNSADINLLLVMLLRNAGLNANPIVLSTVKNGVLLSYVPSITQLNYVIAGVEDGKNIHILDATSKFSKVGIIPLRALNDYGVLVTEKDAKLINILNSIKSVTTLTINAKLNPDGTFSGTFTDNDTNTFAMINQESYADDKTKYQKENYMERYKFPLNNLKTETLADGSFQTQANFTGDNFIDKIGNKWVFNPLLFLYLTNHNFDQTSPRNAPIEFPSRYDQIKKVTITLPEGYSFENLPASKKFRTDDNSIIYTYVVENEGKQLTIETKTSIDDISFQKEYYPVFKQIYDQVTKFEGQVVTVVKK